MSSIMIMYNVQLFKEQHIWPTILCIPWTHPTCQLQHLDGRTLFIYSLYDVQSSDTTHMPATSFQHSLLNQSPALPMTSFTTSGLQDVLNANFIHFNVNACDTTSELSWEDKRSIGVGALPHISLCPLTTTWQSIIRTEWKWLCGAIKYNKNYSAQDLFTDLEGSGGVS